MLCFALFLLCLFRGRLALTSKSELDGLSGTCTVYLLSQDEDADTARNAEKSRSTPGTPTRYQRSYHSPPGALRGWSEGRSSLPDPHANKDQPASQWKAGRLAGSWPQHSARRAVPNTPPVCPCNAARRARRGGENPGVEMCGRAECANALTHPRPERQARQL